MSEARSVWVDYYPGTVQLVRLRKKTDDRFEQQTFVIVNNSVRRKLHPRLRKKRTQRRLSSFSAFSVSAVSGVCLGKVHWEDWEKQQRGRLQEEDLERRVPSDRILAEFLQNIEPGKSAESNFV